MSPPLRLNRGWLLWHGGGLLAAIALGQVAASFHAAGIAPLVILPLGIGVVLGALLYALAATGHRSKRGRVAGRWLIIGTVVLAMVTALAQHAWLYADFRRQWHGDRARSPEAAMFRPETPWSPREYFARELTPQRAALWFADASLMTAAAVGTVLLLQRKQQEIRPRGRR